MNIVVQDIADMANNGAVYAVLVSRIAEIKGGFHGAKSRKFSRTFLATFSSSRQNRQHA